MVFLFFFSFSCGVFGIVWKFFYFEFHFLDFFQFFPTFFPLFRSSLCGYIIHFNIYEVMGRTFIIIFSAFRYICAPEFLPIANSKYLNRSEILWRFLLWSWYTDKNVFGKCFYHILNTILNFFKCNLPQKLSAMHILQNI